MEINKSDIVVSLNGRDADKRFVVIATEDEYSLLADGKGRRVEKPKRKKNKHIRLEGNADSRIVEKFKNEERVTNSEIRRALAEYAANGSGEKGGM